MRRIFTFSFISICFVAASFNSFGQACSGVPFTAVQTYDFGTVAGGTMGFTGGSFTRVTAGGGELSTTIGTSPTTKVLVSPTFIGPASGTNVQFRFDLGLGGTAGVTSYTVELLYENGATTGSTLVCNGATLPNGVITFNVPFPAINVTSGQRFQIRITFNLTGGTNNTVTIDNFATNLTESAIILPVKFSSLDARTTNNSVSLKWTVGSEINVTGYEIEKSSDGRNFAKIGFVTAAAQTSYSFVDPKPSSVSYYRIKSVDGDGKYAYSTVTLVKAGKSMIVLKAFPSPFTNSLSVQHATTNGSSLISISSEDGRLIKTVVPVVGTQQTDINLSSAAPGLYLIRFTNGNKDVETLKILKQ
jgi:hypothetical protein